MIKLNWILFTTMLLFYACTVMYLLLDVHFSKLPKMKKMWGIAFFTFFLALNIGAQMVLGYALYGKFYLLLTQLPVFLLFLYLSEYRGIKLFFVLLTTVFFSSPIMVIRSVLQCFFIPPLWVYFLFYLILIVLINHFFKKPFTIC